MSNLEGLDSHIVILDIQGTSEVKRIINVYRCFNPEGNYTAREKFKSQLNVIKNAMIPKTVILGDFNIDYDKIFNDNYAHKNLFDDFDEMLAEFNLIQMVKFKTWSRMVGTVMRSSILDHVYVENPVVIKNLKSTRPYFGDHLMVEFCINGTKNKPKTIIRRDWRHYSSELLNLKLNQVSWDIDIEDVQGFWNEFEKKLIHVVDNIVPLKEFSLDLIAEKPDKIIKNKINKRNRFLKQFKLRPNIELKRKIANLNFEIKSHFFTKK